MFAIAAWPPFFQVYLLVALLLSGYYLWLMSHYARHWEALPEWSISPGFVPTTKVSVLVPARNEAENVEACLQSILAQSYPAGLLEIIAIDDHSTDDTVLIIDRLTRNFEHLHLLKMSDFPTNKNDTAFKKRAIEKGIALAKGDLIVCTDADCLVPENWLKLIVSFYEQKQYRFIAGPVNFHQEKNTLERFQSLDFLGMMGITGAGIHSRLQHLCNGANLAYEKAAFEKVKGFSGIDGRASGDDMLLLQKMARQFPGRIGFLKNPAATVLTRAMPTWQRFLQQRLRWASKSRDYPEGRVTLRLAMVFFLCWSILLSLLLIPFFGIMALLPFALQALCKGRADYFFLRKMSRYFNRQNLMNSFLPSSVLHVLYIAVVGLLANVIRRYEWKGRRVR